MVISLATLHGMPMNFQTIIFIEMADVYKRQAQIDLYVNLLYGYKIKEVAEEIQKQVKSMVQNMTGITVSKVNIKVTGIVVDSEETFKGDQL